MRRVFVISFSEIMNTAAPVGDAPAIENIYFLLQVSISRPQATEGRPYVLRVSILEFCNAPFCSEICLTASEIEDAAKSGFAGCNFVTI